MDIPQQWVDALRLIQTAFPEAVIAGGALRDLDHGKPVKDLDIFIRRRGAFDFTTLTSVLGPTYSGWVVVGQEAIQYMSDMSADVEEVYTFEKPKLPLFTDPETILPPLNIIALNVPVTLTSVVERLDFGLCRVAHDGERLFVSSDYSKDKSSRMFTILRCNNERELNRSRHRFNRLISKYPGYVLDLSEIPFATI